MKLFTRNLLLILICCTTLNGYAAKTIRIACVGNSITAGARLADPSKEAYPAQLQKMLGNSYEVMNFGVSAMTVLRNCDRAYMSTSLYIKALESDPDIVFIKLGTNDSRLPFRLQVDSFMGDYKTLIHSFKVLPSNPRIVLLLPSSSFLTDTSRQTDAAIVKYILPRIRQVAFDEKLEVIDLHAITSDKQNLYPDNLHPSVEGATILAKRLFEVVTGTEKKGFDIFKKIKEPMTISSFQGYDCVNFTFEGHSCKVVKPRRAAKNLPWIWRACSFGTNPEVDIALLDRGFHLVYCDVAELSNNQEVMFVRNAFYKKMRKSGLSSKVCLEESGCGMVNNYRWAVENPGKVACVCTDDILPMAEHTTIFEEKVKASGKEITVIHKPDANHNPQSFANPQPIVDFILKSVGMTPPY
ncbi:MAG: GDSL-type esterase/lipase family protein [Bacteroidales bacterium]|nr:GDSL-type esterase/lipase family protein [Bacteroidales bacterium]